MRNSVIILLAFVLAAAPAYAALRAEPLEYRHGDTVLEGYLVYDDASKDKRPGVLVVHEWWGLVPYPKKRAEMLAGMGYVAFAIDMYGKGVYAKTQEEAAAMAGVFLKDRGLMRSRARAGLDVLRKHRLVDEWRIAAVGYCFGGTAALELARGGADIKGVVSFHGGLDTPSPEDAKNIRAKVLVLHGADDPFVTESIADAFRREMRVGGVDWQMNYYGGAVHSFSNPASGGDKSKGVAYDREADLRSWEAMKIFFRQIF